MKVKEITLSRVKTVTHSKYLQDKVEAGMTVTLEESDEIEGVVKEVRSDIGILLERLEADSKKEFAQRARGK